MNAAHVSSTIVQCLLQGSGSAFASGLSIDIQVAYYMVPHTSLLPISHSAIKEQGIIALQNVTGMNLDSFLKLLGVYLMAAVVTH